MLLLVLTSYLFVQGPRLWAWHNFFLSPKAIPVFDRLASFGRPRFSRFPKKVMKKVITHKFKTLSVYSATQSMFCHLFFAVHVRVKPRLAISRLRMLLC